MMNERGGMHEPARCRWSEVNAPENGAITGRENVEGLSIAGHDLQPAIVIQVCDGCNSLEAHCNAFPDQIADDIVAMDAAAE